MSAFSPSWRTISTSCCAPRPGWSSGWAAGKSHAAGCASFPADACSTASGSSRPKNRSSAGGGQGQDRDDSQAAVEHLLVHGGAFRIRGSMRQPRGRLFGPLLRGPLSCREIGAEGALLVCGMYVDLNPIRAGEVRTPEEALHTSASFRIRTRGRLRHNKSRMVPRPTAGWLP